MRADVVLLSMVAAALVTLIVLAVMRPVVFRMAARNALRRKTQTLVVVGGLMVGTAIISGSFASGDSLANGIRQGAYDGLGPADVFVQLEGQLHFPRVLYDDLRAAPDVAASIHAMSPLLYEDGTLTHPGTRLTEPRVNVVGIEPETNRPFGTFRTLDGRNVDGGELTGHEAYLLEELAVALDARAGDTLDLTYAQPPVPRVPRLTAFDGRLTASAGVCAFPEPLCQYVATPDAPATFNIPVALGAVGVTTIVAWGGPGSEHVDLDQVLRAPDGTTHVNADGSPLAPDNPSVLAVAPDEDAHAVAAGDWTLEVRSKAAANQPFRVIALVYHEEYNLTALQEFAQEAEAAGLDPDLLAANGERELLSARIVVKDVVRPEGFGDFLLGKNLFMRQDAVATLYGQEGMLNIVLVSGHPDPRKGLDETQRLLDVLEPAIAESAAKHAEHASLMQVEATAVKQEWLEAADRAGNLFKEFLTTIGSFTVIAGLMLIVNIFVMLAEERKGELGMARAVGLTRRQLVLLFSFEGALYALVASLVGVVLGLGLAATLIWGINNLLSRGNAADSLVSFPFHVEPSSIGISFAIGFLLTLATILLASWKVSRLNIVRAIRRIEEPPHQATRAAFAFGIGLAAVGGAGALYGFASGHFVSQVLGPSVGLIGLGLTANRWMPARFAFPLSGAAVAGYAAWSFFLLGNPDGVLNRIMGPVRGVLIVLAAALIIVHVPQLVRGTRSILLRFKGLVPAVRPGIAYPLEKKTRTGLTITMFGLVVLVMVAFSIFTATFTVDLEAQAGGYDVEGETTVPLTDLRAWHAREGDASLPDPFARVERHDELRFARVFGGRMVEIEGERIHYQGPPVDYVYTFDAEFARHNRFIFESHDAAYATPEDVYLAVLRDPSLVIISLPYNFDETGQPGRHKVGDTLTMQTATGTQQLRIVGIQNQIYLGGIWVHPDVVDANFQRVRGQYLFKLHEGEDPALAAREVEAAFAPAGMDAASIREEAAKLLEQNRRFLTLFQLFLGFGLVVGIASLGIVTARSVIERRQEIGMLRAVGYPRDQILKIFMIEILFTTTLGILVGTSIGIFISYGVVATSDGLESLGVTFTIPWWDIARILLLTYVAVILTTWYPARQASRIAPAEAVRYIE